MIALYGRFLLGKFSSLNKVKHLPFDAFARCRWVLFGLWEGKSTMPDDSNVQSDKHPPCSISDTKLDLDPTPIRAIPVTFMSWINVSRHGAPVKTGKV